MKLLSTCCGLLLLLMSISALSAFAQITPSDDSYTLTSSPTANFGAKNTLLVESAGATTSPSKPRIQTPVSLRTAAVSRSHNPPVPPAVHAVPAVTPKR
jgi:hypothetical protein